MNPTTTDTRETTPSLHAVGDTAQAILRDPDIQRYIESHQAIKPRVEKAAKVLEGKPDAREAVKKLIPSLEKGVIHVFFSYKTKDKEAARTLVNHLRSYSSVLVIEWMDEFFREGGRPFPDKIRQAIGQANWFIFLLSDRNDDWDWNLYETGLFAARITSADRLICLHHPDVPPPEPIRQYHHFRTDESDLQRFLNMVYVQDNPIPGLGPINPNVRDKVPEIARAIKDAIRPPTIACEQHCFGPYVILEIERARDMTGYEDLLNAKIINVSKDALKLFGLMDIGTPATWRELTSRVVSDHEHPPLWSTDLREIIRHIANSWQFNPSYAVFVARDGKTYEAEVCGVKRVANNGPVRNFHIKFKEDVVSIDTSTMPRHVAALAEILRIAFRFRYEVLRKYRQGRLSAENLGALENAVKRIEIDARTRGLVDESTVLNMFSESERAPLVRMFQRWHELRREDGTGTLDKAILEKDVHAISEVIEELVPLNKEFVEITSMRFAQVLAALD